MNLAARAGVFVMPVVELRGAEILADLEIRQQPVGGFDSLVNLMRVDLTFGFAANGGGGAVGMKFDLQMILRIGFRWVDLDFVKVDRKCDTGRDDDCQYGKRHRQSSHHEIHFRNSPTYAPANPRRRAHRVREPTNPFPRGLLRYSKSTGRAGSQRSASARAPRLRSSARARHP